ncbi:MAG: sulfotransferase family protein [bacterium]|jgi:hypothetical protein
MSELIPIFSGGVGRSGTTIVGRILRNHSDLFAGSPFEIKFITEVHGLIDLVFGQRSFLPTQISRKGYLLSKISQKDPIKFRFHKFARRINEDWWKRTNRLGMESGLHRALTMRELNALLEELEGSLDSPIQAARNFVFGYVRKHRKWRGETFWMDTTPANMMYADYIHSIFPEARFIEMRRDPLDNIASVLKEPWGPNDPERAILWWKDRISLATSAKEKIPTHKHLTIDLENLVLRNRTSNYEAILSLVGLKDERRMRNYFETEVTIEKANIGRWKRDFPDPNGFLKLFNELTS